jgi:hypothetical protein
MSGILEFYMILVVIDFVGFVYLACGFVGFELA